MVRVRRGGVNEAGRPGRALDNDTAGVPAFRVPESLLRALPPFRAFTRNARLFLTGTFFVGFGLGTFWVLFNLYLKELGHGEALIGRILTVGSAGTFLVALPAAWLVNRYPTRLILILAAVAAGSGYALMVLPVPLPVVMGAAALASAAFSVHNIAASPFFMRNSSPGERMELFGWHYGLEVLAGVIGAAGGGFLARKLAVWTGDPVLAYRATLLGAAALVFLATVPLSALREGAPPRTMARLTDVLAGTNWSLLTRLALPKFLTGLGAGLIIPFLNLYFRNRFKLTPDAIGSIFAVAQFITVGAYILGPRVARRFGMIRAAAGTELLSIPFFVLLAFTQQVEWAIFGFWMRGALMNMNQPIADNFAMEMVGKEHHAVTNSVISLLWHAAWMITAQAGGWLIEHHGFRLPMLITVAFYILASSLYLVFFHDAERRIIEPRRAAERLAATSSAAPAPAGPTAALDSP
jgi:MFS family permease